MQLPQIIYFGYSQSRPQPANSNPCNPSYPNLFGMGIDPDVHTQSWLKIGLLEV